MRVRTRTLTKYKVEIVDVARGGRSMHLTPPFDPV